MKIEEGEMAVEIDFEVHLDQPFEPISIEKMGRSGGVQAGLPLSSGGTCQQHRRDSSCALGGRYLF